MQNSVIRLVPYWSVLVYWSLIPPVIPLFRNTVICEENILYTWIHFFVHIVFTFTTKTTLWVSKKFYERSKGANYCKKYFILLKCYLVQSIFAKFIKIVNRRLFPITIILELWRNRVHRCTVSVFFCSASAIKIFLQS